MKFTFLYVRLNTIYKNQFKFLNSTVFINKSTYLSVSSFYKQEIFTRTIVKNLDLACFEFFITLFKYLNLFFRKENAFTFSVFIYYIICRYIYSASLFATDSLLSPIDSSDDSTSLSVEPNPPVRLLL